MTTRRPLVYIVDDQVANVRLLESILRIGDVADSRGFGDAREALAALGDDAPDLILLDLQMPHLDGFGFMAALSERANEDDFLPVLVITADINRDIRRRALRAGAHDFLTKPFDVDEVVARCQNLLRTRRLHLALSERNQGLRGELDEQISTLEQERRERAAIVSSLALIEPLETMDATARRICSELVRVGNVDAAAIVQVRASGEAVPLAAAGMTSDAASRLRVIPEASARFLRSQADHGPWVEEQIGSSTDRSYRTQLAMAGVRSAVYAPMRVGGEVVAVIVGMTRERQSTEQLVKRLHAVVDYAAVAGALIGTQLAFGAKRSQVRADLEAVIGLGAMRPVFQPVVGMASGDVVGFEALTRFTDGERPDRRFADAQSVGMTIPLELACLRQALASAHDLPDGSWLSLNVSPALVLAGDKLQLILEDCRRPLVLEVTEHSPVEDYQALKAAIVAMGPRVRLAIDDAGAGFASFRHILELKPDFVKLDLGLVRGIAHDPARQALVAGMQYFSTRTDCALIAEGIETADERSMLTELGVSLGQGFLLGRPGPVETWRSARHADRGTEGSTPRRPTTAGVRTPAA
jgi:EAL domain-containing protein (putative c-di-GMP-specific phosphodiesterase class I)/DNA-binding response OmpR family regulator